MIMTAEEMMELTKRNRDTWAMKLWHLMSDRGLSMFKVYNPGTPFAEDEMNSFLFAPNVYITGVVKKSLVSTSETLQNPSKHFLFLQYRLGHGKEPDGEGLVLDFDQVFNANYGNNWPADYMEKFDVIVKGLYQWLANQK